MASMRCKHVRAVSGSASVRTNQQDFSKQHMASKLKVVQVGKFYYPARGGIETHVKDLCEELRDHVDLEVAVADGGRRSSVDFINGVRVRRFSQVLNVSRAPVCPGLFGYLRRTAADIVHIHTPNPAAVCAYLASGNRARLVISYHSDILRQRLLGGIFSPLMRLALSRASAIIVGSPAYLNTSGTLAEFHHLCRIVPYSIPSEAFHEQRQSEPISNDHRPLILSVGRLVGYKGFEFLIRAMQHVQARLVIVGNGERAGVLRKEIVQLGLEDRVFVLQNVDDVGSYYRDATLFVLPSIARTEAFGIVQLEAMARGVPVINTQLDSGVPWVSLNGVTGITVPPRDPVALAAAINNLLHNDDLRRQMGCAARERARQFSTQALTESMLGVYRDVTADGAVPARSVFGLSKSAFSAPVGAQSGE